MTPFWLKLLREYRKNRGYGLALPFLVGAMRIPVGSVVADKNNNIAEVIKLLSSMRDETPDTSYISLTVCDRLHQPVFVECSRYFKPSASYARIPTLDGNKCFLYVAQQILPCDKQSVEDLREALWQRNGDAILQGCFSHNKGTFTKYSANDLALISSASYQADDCAI